MKEVYYVKSFEEDFATKTLHGKNKVTYQTVQDIVKHNIIKPNTKSFGRKRRLSCTILNDKYTKTYRPQGIIFQTSQSPDYILPFDLVLLSATDKIIVHYYRIKNNLHVYYNHALIPGFEEFVFKNFSSLISKYNSPEEVWNEVNKFRMKNGFNKLQKSKFRLVEYNEAVFHKNVRIRPVAIFGYRPKTRKIAKQLNLPRYTSARDFYQSFNKTREEKNFLMVGRFQPFHLGHLYLIRRYADAGFFIKIGVGSSQKGFENENPLTFNERKHLIEKAMKESRIRKYKIYAIPDIKKDSKYVDHVMNIVGSFSTIATGNALVLRLFKSYKPQNSWNIESFEESDRPGGKITASLIRKKWLIKPDKYGLQESVFKYLKSLNFSAKLNELKG